MNLEILKKFGLKLWKHRTFKNVGYLTLGNVFSQIIALVGAFYIPKLLGPEQYGIYNTVVAYVGLFGVFTLSGLNKVIIRETAKDTSKTQEILEATIGLRNLFSIFSSILAVVVVLFINYDLGTKVYVIIYSFSLLLKGTESSLGTIFQSSQKMKILGVITTTKQLVRVPLSILFLFLGYGVISLILIQLLVELLGALILYKFSRRILLFNFYSKVKFLKEYVLSGIRFSLIEFLNVLSGKIDILMLSFLTTPDKVGIYALAYRLVEKGLIIRGPFSQSLFPYYSEKYTSKEPKLKEMFRHSFLIFGPLLLFLIPSIIFIETLIYHVIGPDFLESASIFSVLTMYLLFNFSNIPFGLALQTTANEKYVLFIVISTAITNILLNIILFNNYSIIGIAYSTLIVELIRLVLLIYYSRRYVIT